MLSIILIGQLQCNIFQTSNGMLCACTEKLCISPEYCCLICQNGLSIVYMQTCIHTPHDTCSQAKQMVLTMYLCCVGGRTITYPHTHMHTHMHTHTHTHTCTHTHTHTHTHAHTHTHIHSLCWPRHRRRLPLL